WPMASTGMPACAIAAFAVATPSSAGGVSLSAPPKVPIAVRMAETRKTSVMSGFPWRKEAVRERGLRARLRPSCAGRSDRLAAGRTSDVGARAGDDQLNNYFNKCSIEHGAAETPPAGSRRAAQAPDFPACGPLPAAGARAQHGQRRGLRIAGPDAAVADALAHQPAQGALVAAALGTHRGEVLLRQRAFLEHGDRHAVFAQELVEQGVERHAQLLAPVAA